MNVRMPEADGTHRLGVPANFDDTTPAQNRPIQASLEPATIVHELAHYRARWACGPSAMPWDAPPEPRQIVDVMFDIDDVLCPTIDEIHELARLAGYHDGSIEPAWDGVGQYGLEDRPQAYWDLWSDFAAAGGYVKTPPIPEAAEALRRLYWAGHRIHLVTARGFMAHAQDIREWTPQWLEEFAIPWHTLTFAQDKVAAQVQVFDAIGQPGERTDILDGAGQIVGRQVLSRRFDYAIDDRRKTIEALRAVGVEAYLLTHSHNREEHSEHRVGSVTEFVEIILDAAQS